MRKIALTITAATALTAITACSTEPLPEPVLETLIQETQQGMHDVSLAKLTDEIKYAMQAVKNEEESTAKEKSKGVSVNGMNVEVVGSFVPADSAHNGYSAWREYEVIDASGNVVQCFGVEHDTSDTPVIDCNFPAPR